MTIFVGILNILCVFWMAYTFHQAVLADQWFWASLAVVAMGLNLYSGFRLLA